MSFENAIEVNDVAKRFKLQRGGTRTLKSAVLDMLRYRKGPRELWALKEISFTVPRGETLGIIGANGAGKSTFLSLVAGTMMPTCGDIKSFGTISSLLELGAGFHPDLTGRENVFLNGAIMGLSRKQMRERFDAIVEFAGIRDFIDEPVKHYSSGMYVRLGFAVAVELDPDILIIDEVLAVGDAEFQRKCIDKIRDFRKRRKTMLIVSHDLATIQSISDRILLLDEGTIKGLGKPNQVISDYQAFSRSKSTKGVGREWGTGEVTITGVEFRDSRGQKTDKFRWGESLEARVSYNAAQRVDNPVFGFALADENARVIYGNNTQIEKFIIPFIEGVGTVILKMKSLPMAQGTYLFSFSIHSADHRQNYHRLDNFFPIAIQCEKSFEGCSYIESEWTACPK